MLAIVVVPICAAGQKSEDEGQNLGDWIAKTRPERSVADRREAIRMLEKIARTRLDLVNRRPAARDAARDWISQEIIPTLNVLLKDQEAAVRGEAVLAICAIDRQASEATIPALIELLGDPSETIRDDSAAALSFRGPAIEPAIPALVKVVRQDPFRDIRHSAAVALRTGGSKGVEALLELLNDPSADVRHAAVSRFAGRYPAGRRSVLPVVAVHKLEALLEDESEEVRKSAAVSLANTDGVTAETIAKTLYHKDGAVRHAAGH
jgi:HEAT repeat protein